MVQKIRILRAAANRTRRKLLRSRYYIVIFFGAFLLIRSHLHYGIFETKPDTLLHLPFTWISNNERICETEAGWAWPPWRSPPLLPVLVHTKRANAAHRLAIRKTYGSVRSYMGWELRVIFLLGQAPPWTNSTAKQDKLLQAEQARYGDLVIGSFLDTYRNLSYKHLMGYKWILSFCRRAEFALKVDDDFLVDTPQWVDWIIADPSPDIRCDYGKKLPPFRKKGSKWYVSFEEWPAPRYPNYCSALGYLFRTSLMEKIYRVSEQVKFFWVDDIFVTGVLLEEAKRTFKFQPKIEHLSEGISITFMSGQNRELCKNGRLDYLRNFGVMRGVHRDKFFASYMECLWKKVMYDQAQAQLSSKNKN